MDPIDPADRPQAADDDLPLAQYAQQAYLEYALSVVKGRALPDVTDGQKPVQRRILYAMDRLGLSFGASGVPKAVKSARVVGDVLGRFHPHGDQAAYDALVRMAQDFSQRYPLVDGLGNFGSRDGDGAAAMRYTEARLAPIARLLLDEIDQGTVDFVPNYDGSTIEPLQLPARLPFVLLNGASGIAVGLATEIPSHNLGEVAAAAVALLRDPGLSDDALQALLPGPDFPGGAQIISAPADIRAAYASGRGSLKVRARWKFEERARGQWQLVVTELPPNTNAQRVLEEVEGLTNPRPRAGRKTLAPEQLQVRAALLAVLDGVRDESSKEAAVRLVFEPKSGRTPRADLVGALLAQTSLEASVPVNLTMIGRDGRPLQKSLREVLSEWLAFRSATVRRRSEQRLAKVLERIHILEGRQLVLLNLDEVIHIIRTADDPKAALVARWGLTERQAEDILEIRLRQLARLEAIRIEQELAALRGEQKSLEAVLASPAALQRLVIREIEADAKRYGDARRTLIEEEERATSEVRLVDEPVTVVVSARGWVRVRAGHGYDAQGFSFKAGDALYGAFECRTVDTLVGFGSNGRVYSAPVASLPGARGDGVPFTSLVELEPGTEIVHYWAAAAAVPLLVATSGGHGFLATLGDLTTRQRGGKAFVTLAAGEALCRPALAAGAQAVACVAASRRLLTFGIDEVERRPAGGRGLKLMGLEAGDRMVAAAAYVRAVSVVGTGRGGKRRAETLEIRSLNNARMARGKKGRKADFGFDPDGLVRIE